MARTTKEYKAVNYWIRITPTFKAQIDEAIALIRQDNPDQFYSDAEFGREALERFVARTIRKYKKY